MTLRLDSRTSNSGFRPEAFERLANLEANNFWFRSRNLLILWALGRYFPNASRFLEIGCGTGFILSSVEKSFPRLLLFGSDIYAEGLQFASKRLERARLLQMGAKEIPFKNEFFDVIGAFDVLEHVEEDEQMIARIYQALKPGGGLMLTVPQHPFLWSRFDEYSCHVRRYRAQELMTKVEKAGFELLRTTSFVSFLLPLMVISRFKSKWSKQEKDPLSELEMGEWANALLEKVLGFERRLIQIGISFPWGGSLMLIARKS